MKCLSHVTPTCPLSGPTLWKPNGSILSLVVGFFGWSLTRAKVCFVSSKHSFGYHVSASLLMCGFKGRCLVNSLSYHTNISFIISPFFYNTSYPSWLATSYNCPPFMMLMWSYHYPFTLVPLWEWTHDTFRDIIVTINLENGAHV
jgi:hypothetical protein